MLLGILGVAIIVSLIYRIPRRQWLRTSMEELLRFRAPPWRQTLSQHPSRLDSKLLTGVCQQTGESAHDADANGQLTHTMRLNARQRS